MAKMPINLTSLKRIDFEKFLSSFDTILTDCDGVIWLENQVIDNANLVLNKFRDMGKRVFYVTNNSTKTREEFLGKFHKLGFYAEPENIISTSYLVGEHLKNINFTKKAYVIGSPGLIKELDRFNIKHTDIGPDAIDSNLETYIKSKLYIDPEVGAVLVAFDEHFSYPKMLKAAVYLENPDCLFIGTNTDERVPVGKNLILPGTGSILRCIETLSERKALVVGKPTSFIKDVLDQRGCNIDPEKTLMIGDRCNTDILFGKRCGFQTLLVLTGVTRLDEVHSWAKSKDPELKDLVPNYYMSRLGDFLEYL